MTQIILQTLVGGSSLIPSVQKSLKRMFGSDRVSVNRPLDAVARGAAAFVSGIDFYDHIQHDYAIRHYDSASGDYTFKVIVKHGTSYPTSKPLAKMTVKATHNGQTHLGINIFEMGQRIKTSSETATELVWDPSGAARLVKLAPHDVENRRQFWMNEHQPTFLLADPPARKGEERFEVSFGIDGNKRLIMTAFDLVNQRITHHDFPVVKLS